MNRKLKISLYLAAIFVAGVFTGIFISIQVARHMMPSREKMVDRWCGELESRLNLTPEQTAKIRPIVDRTMTDFIGSLSREMRSDLSNCYARIALELTPDQKTKLEQMQREKEDFIRSRIGDEASGEERQSGN